MPEKPSGYSKIGLTSTMHWEEKLCEWLKSRFVQLGQTDLQEHVRTFVGVFKQSQQDLAQDIKEEPQYPLEAKKVLNSKPCLDDLRKLVLVYELQKLINLISFDLVKDLTEDLISEYKILTSVDRPWSKTALQSAVHAPLANLERNFDGKPASRSEPVSRTEQAASYTDVFPALSGQGCLSVQPLNGCWRKASLHQEALALASDYNILRSKNVAAKASAPRKNRLVGKENDMFPDYSEFKGKIAKSKDQRGKKSASSFSSYHQKSEKEQCMDAIRKDIKRKLGIADQSPGPAVASPPSRKANQIQPIIPSNIQQLKDPPSSSSSSISFIAATGQQRVQVQDLPASQAPRSQHQSSQQPFTQPPPPDSPPEPAPDFLSPLPWKSSQQPFTQSPPPNSLPEPAPDFLSPLPWNSSIWSSGCSLSASTHPQDPFAQPFSHQDALPEATADFLSPLPWKSTIWSSDCPLRAWPDVKPAASPETFSSPLLQLPQEAVDKPVNSGEDFSDYKLFATPLQDASSVFSSSFLQVSDRVDENAIVHCQMSKSRECPDVPESRNEDCQESQEDWDTFGLRALPSKIAMVDQTFATDEAVPLQSEGRLHLFLDTIFQSLQQLSSDSSCQFFTPSSSAPDCLVFSAETFSPTLNPWLPSPDVGYPPNPALADPQHECTCEGACNCLSSLAYGLDIDACPFTSLSHQPFDVLSFLPSLSDLASQQGHSQALTLPSPSAFYAQQACKSAFTRVHSSTSTTKKKISWQDSQLYLASKMTPCRRPVCLVKDASLQQLKILEERRLKVITPQELESKAEKAQASVSASAAVPYGLRFNDCAKNCTAASSDSVTETARESHFPPLISCSDQPAPKQEYEEKVWKDLDPLTEEDRHRDALHALAHGYRLDIDLDAFEDDPLDDTDQEFEHLSESPNLRSASLPSVQNWGRVRFASDLEREWRNQTEDCHLEQEWIVYSFSPNSQFPKKSGKNKTRRSFHANKPCSFFLEGCCYRADCKYSHDISTITCHFWEEGQCFKGDHCPFLHGYSKAVVVAKTNKEFDMSKDDFPELSRKQIHGHGGPAAKRRKNLKKSMPVPELQDASE